MSSTSSVFALFVTVSLALGQACSNAGGAGAGNGGTHAGGSSRGGTLGSGGLATGGAAAGQGGAGAGASTGVGTVDAAIVGGAGGTGAASASGGATGAGAGPGGASSGGAIGSGGTVRTGGSSGVGGGAGMIDGGRMGSGGVAGGTAVPGTTGGVGRSGGAIGTAGARTGGSPGLGGVGGAGGGNQPYKGVANSPKDQLAALGATWCYNWGTTPKATDCTDPLFVPMVWGKDNVASAIKAIGDAGYKTVLGFNEPNKTDQANMTVDEAIALWPTLTSNPDIRVGSPAVSDDGRAWLVSFMTQAKAKGLRVDFIAMHWYGWNAGSCTAGQLEGAVNWAQQWNLPVWVTEFGCMGSSNPDDQTLLTFFGNAIPMLKKHTLVERWAWYPWNDHNHLYSPDANDVPVMTDLGKAFAGAPQYK